MGLATTGPRGDEHVEALVPVLARSVGALAAAGIRYVLVGGLASSFRGRPRTTADVDLLVAPQDAERALEALAAAGFATERTNPHWIYKATASSVVVDVIFAVKGGIYLDDRMLGRATVESVDGVAVTVAAPEDLIVMKAVAHDEASVRHWHGPRAARQVRARLGLPARARPARRFGACSACSSTSSTST